MSDAPSTPANQRMVNSLLRIVIVALALVLALVVILRLDKLPRTEDAEVRANIIGIAPQVAGALTHLYVTDNQFVKEGDLLFEIDARPYEAEAAKAKARTELVKQEIKALDSEIAAAEATLKDRVARATYAKAHHERVSRLLAGNYASEDRVQHALAEAESAAAQVREAEATVNRATSNLGEVNGHNTRVEEAEAALRDAELRMSYCKVYAPRDGHVTNLQVSPGTFVPAGGQVFSLIDSSAWFVLANFRETDLSDIKPGQRATVYLMANPGQPLKGIVQGISRGVYPLEDPSASPGGQGILSRVQPTFDFVQLAQRFPVRIILDEPDAPAFRMGGKASVIIDTGSAPDAERLRQLQKPELRSYKQPVADE
jgi:multidrug efflux system membrane fusion protein